MEIAIHCAHDKQVPIADLKPHPQNPNTHPEPQIALLAKIIREQGWRNPIVVSNRSGFITKGHARRLAALRIGLELVPVDYQDYGSEKQELADMIADNRIAELAEADRSMLRELAEQLDDGAFDMDLTGFDHDALEELMTAAPPDSDIDAEPQIDKAEELRVKWGVERGQIWELGEHRIMCGDSTSINGSTEQCDMVFTDPPYNVDYVGKTKDALKIRNDSMSNESFDAFLDSSFRFPLRPGGVFYVCSPPGCTETQFRNAINRTGILLLKQCIVWVKDIFVMGRQDYHWRHESILYGWREGAAHRSLKDRTQDTVWEIPRPKRSLEHPTIKPTPLVAKAISNSSKWGDLVWDGFSGSGTTIIACEQLGRKCRAMEIDPGYVAVSIQRWADATGKTPKLLK